MRLLRAVPVLILALLMLPATTAVFAGTPPTPKVNGLWITNGGERPVFITTAKELQATANRPILGKAGVAASDAELESMYCMFFGNGLPSGPWCAESCSGVVAPGSGSCCWICPAACTWAYLAACPGDNTGSGPGICKKGVTRAICAR